MGGIFLGDSMTDNTGIGPTSVKLAKPHNRKYVTGDRKVALYSAQRSDGSRKRLKLVFDTVYSMPGIDGNDLVYVDVETGYEVDGITPEFDIVVDDILKSATEFEVIDGTHPSTSWMSSFVTSTIKGTAEFEKDGVKYKAFFDSPNTAFLFRSEHANKVDIAYVIIA